MAIEQQLEQLGLDRNEIRSYISLAEVGKTTAAHLSERSGIPRTTVYTTLKGLIDKGLISVEHSTGTSFFVVNDPSAIVRFIEKQQEEIVARMRIAKEVSQLIIPYLRSVNYEVPKLQFFEGKRNVENMLFQYLPIWRKSFEPANDWTVWGFVDHTLHAEYRRWTLHRWSLMEDSPREQIRLFSNLPAIAEQKEQRVPRREIRMLPKDITITCSALLYGEYIIILLTREKPHVAFQLHSPVFAENFRAILRLLWQLTN